MIGFSVHDTIVIFDRIREDLRKIKGLGFNTVRCWVDWASGQPSELRYTFDSLEVILELAEEAGLDLTLTVQVGTTNLRDSLALARQAARCGVALVASVPPYYYGHPEREVVYFYQRLVEGGLPGRAGAESELCGVDGQVVGGERRLQQAYNGI